ncbi:autophagy protein atg9 [Globomyces sp. JEL0801]|nr:autophagy protein atg9 [Globomyces sp. JEL0801]
MARSVQFLAKTYIRLLERTFKVWKCEVKFTGDEHSYLIELEMPLDQIARIEGGIKDGSLAIEIDKIHGIDVKLSKFQISLAPARPINIESRKTIEALEKRLVELEGSERTRSIDLKDHFELKPYQNNQFSANDSDSNDSLEPPFEIHGIQDQIEQELHIENVKTVQSHISDLPFPNASPANLPNQSVNNSSNPVQFNPKRNFVLNSFPEPELMAVQNPVKNMNNFVNSNNQFQSPSTSNFKSGQSTSTIQPKQSSRLNQVVFKDDLEENDSISIQMNTNDVRSSDYESDDDEVPSYLQYETAPLVNESNVRRGNQRRQYNLSHLHVQRQRAPSRSGRPELHHEIYEWKDVRNIDDFLGRVILCLVADAFRILWKDVVVKIVETSSTDNTHTLPKLDAHKIANRILRKENYMIAMFNKDILSLNIPLLGQRQWMTWLMQDFLIYGIFSYVFDGRGLFRKRFLKSQNKFITFLSGSLATVLLLITLFEEDLQQGFEITPNRSAFFYIGLFGSIMTIAQGLTQENVVHEPQKWMLEVVSDTHYHPDEWRDKAHTPQSNHPEWDPGNKGSEFTSRILRPLMNPKSTLIHPLRSQLGHSMVMHRMMGQSQAMSHSEIPPGSLIAGESMLADEYEDYGRDLFGMLDAFYKTYGHRLN